MSTPDLKAIVASRFDDVWDFLTKTGDVAVLLVDQHASLRACNDGFWKLLGYREAPADTSIQQLLTSASFSTLQSSVSGEIPSTLTLNFLTVDGSLRPLLCSLYPQNDGYLIMGRSFPMSDDDVLRKMTVLSNESINLARQLRRQNRTLERARENIRILSGIIPICMHCKQIRDDEGYWTQLEQFISEHSEATFSHGICPSCIDTYYPDLKK